MPKQLVGDDQRADRVVAGAAAGVADDVGVALGEAGVLGRVEAGVHAGEDGEMPARRHRQLALVAKVRRVGLVGCHDFVQRSCSCGSPFDVRGGRGRAAVAGLGPSGWGCLQGNPLPQAPFEYDKNAV